MGKIVAGLFTSLDGVVDADDDWQFPYCDEELFAGITAGWHSTGALLLGRRSYEGYERVRVEHPDSPMLAFQDATPTYVVSSTLDNARRANVRTAGATPARARSTWQSPGRTICSWSIPHRSSPLPGGWSLVSRREVAGRFPGFGLIETVGAALTFVSSALGSSRA